MGGRQRKRGRGIENMKEIDSERQKKWEEVSGVSETEKEGEKIENEEKMNERRAEKKGTKEIKRNE